MLQELCRNAFWNACKEVSEKNYDLVRLKSYSKAKETEYKYKNFYEYETYPRYRWDRCPLEKVYKANRNGTYYTKQRSWAWFNEHANLLRDTYIKKRYRGNLESAMEECKTFTALFDCFYDYFDDRRNEFMEKTNDLVKQKQNELAKIGKHPQSHGGVANLLKVLTKTMHEQGNSIYTIAKVQYHICLQAGIYIPDEFLTDILVAGEIIDDK